MHANNRKYAVLFLVLPYFHSLTGQEQYPLNPFVQINTNKEVIIRRSIQEGKNGFIWIATNNGLCRFDGQRFKFYQNDPKNTSSIISNEVFTVLPVEDEIWAGTNKGISVLDIPTQQFCNYQLDENGKVPVITNEARKDVISLFKDRQGEIWVGTSYLGFWKYDAENDDFIHFEPARYPAFAPSMFPLKEIWAIEQSCTNDSIIWAGTGAGLMEVNKYNHEVRFFTFPQKDKTYQTGVNAFRRLYHHKDGLLYAGTWAGGVHVFDPVKRTLTPLEVRNDPGNRLAKYSVSSMIPKSEDEIWVTSGTGLFLYSISEKGVVDHNINDFRNEVYYGIHLIDKGNRAWYSNYQGLFLHDPYLKQFRTFSFDPFLVDGRISFVFLQEYDQQNDRIVVCPRFTDGLFLFNRQDQSWTISRFNNISQFSGEEPLLGIYGFGRLNQEEYVLSGNEGVFRYHPGEYKLKPILRDERLKDIRWTWLCVDHENKLWIGTRASGLYRVEPNTGRYEEYRKEFLLMDTIPPRIGLLFEDSRHNIWIKRMDGLSVFDRENGQFRHFLYSNNPDNSFPVIDAFAEDHQGRVWTCSGTDWLGFMEAAHPEKGVVRKVDISKSGVEGHILSLRSDPEGNIWGCTTKDIFRIDREGGVASRFSLKYSSVPIDFFGMEMLPDGQLAIGGRKELTLTYPQQLKRNEELPVPYISQVNVRQKPFKEAYPLFGGHPLQLRYNENFFSIAYAAQAFTFGKEVRFRYRLQGLEEWVDAGDGLVANYTSVPPGAYTFQLMAANNEGVWNEAMLEIPVIIRQAWYKSWWFLLLVGLFISLLGYSFFNYRISQVRKEEKLKAMYEKKLTGVEMSALVAQMNPHFLFNSLNSIDSYIIKNESVKASEYLNNFARLMRLILQNSRSSYISLEDEIEGMELYLQMESLRFTCPFTYDIHIDPGLDIHQIEIPPMLIQPYLENAIWHGLRPLEAGKKGIVEISFAVHQGKLKVIIVDNGIGRKKSAELRKKKSETHKKSMGMDITKSRIDMINKLYNADASVTITDLYDQNGNAAGTKVVLTIAT